MVGRNLLAGLLGGRIEEEAWAVNSLQHRAVRTIGAGPAVTRGLFEGFVRAAGPPGGSYG